MTADCEPAPTVATRIVSPPFVRLLLACAGSGISFYLLLSVVPLYVGSAAAAGLTTGVMLLATVLTELAMPALTARLGYRTLVALGLVLLGAPAAMLTISPALPLVLAVCVARGAGLAVMVVAGTALVAELVPADRRGEGLGVYGVAVGVPAVLGLPLGVYLSARAGFDTVFLLATVVGLAGLAAVSGLPGRRTTTRGPGEPSGLLRGLGDSGLLPPAAVFGAVTLAAGVVVTFLPLAVPAERHGLVAVALLIQALLAPVARWVAGRYGDRRGYGALLVPSVALTALGVAALIRFDSSAAVVAGMVAFGIGFGAAQCVTLAVMFSRAPAGGHERVSALWNLAYDLGMGVGAAGFGILVAATGYAGAFAVTALVLVAALIPAWRDHSSGVPAT